jgi:hypothetical protein
MFETGPFTAMLKRAGFLRERLREGVIETRLVRDMRKKRRGIEKKAAAVSRAPSTPASMKPPTPEPAEPVQLPQPSGVDNPSPQAKPVGRPKPATYRDVIPKPLVNKDQGSTIEPQGKPV